MPVTHWPKMHHTLIPQENLWERISPGQKELGEKKTNGESGASCGVPSPPQGTQEPAAPFPDLQQEDGVLAPKDPSTPKNARASHQLSHSGLPQSCAAASTGHRTPAATQLASPPTSAGSYCNKPSQPATSPGAGGRSAGVQGPLLTYHPASGTQSA